MTEQMSFNFPQEENYSANNFIVFSGNLEAFCLLNQARDDSEALGNQIIFLHGEEKSGKTHLGQIWRHNHGAINMDLQELVKLDFEEFVPKIGSIIEKLEYYLFDNFPSDIEEDKFFYLINTVITNGSSALFITRDSIPKKHRTMKDLESRIRGGIDIRIGKLSSDAKPMLINKLFADRQIFLGGDLLKYLNTKLGTNYREIYDHINRIVLEVSNGGQRLTISFLKTIL
ncbi:MAG: hypothetical protein LBI70_02630 [Rickettsiales bacterium]|jgi:chromosomal replication initiation ATPase DnaA|nr:hypothetical protein [Rickettsiales bacterium]